jgi:hypothetical protein
VGQELKLVRFVSKKSLKIPEGQSESVYRRRTDNTIDKRKSTKGQQRSTKHAYKTEDRVTRTPLKPSSRSTSGTRRVNLVTNPVASQVASRVFFNKLCYY